MGSGYQKFIIDMIMRITLTRISVLSNPNIIFIDEGFGSLDRENFILIANILAKLKNNFDAMIIITHLDELKAYADISMDIHRIQSSTLQYGSLTQEEKKIRIMNETRAASAKNTEYKEQEYSKLEETLIVKGNDEFTCVACNKTLKDRKGAIKRHLTSKSLLAKHMKASRDL
jgi:ABC-type multidrug transport system ATPase subunit